MYLQKFFVAIGCSFDRTLERKFGLRLLNYVEFKSI